MSAREDPQVLPFLLLTQADRASSLFVLPVPYPPSYPRRPKGPLPPGASMAAPPELQVAAAAAIELRPEPPLHGELVRLL